MLFTSQALLSARFTIFYVTWMDSQFFRIVSNGCNPVTSIAREHEVRMTSLRTSVTPPLCQPPLLLFSIQSPRVHYILFNLCACLLDVRMHVRICVYSIQVSSHSIIFVQSSLRVLIFSILAGWIVKLGIFNIFLIIYRDFRFISFFFFTNFWVFYLKNF